jgi:hypothetical protein
MRPLVDLASTRYVLAAPGREYLVYQPDGGPFTVDLGAKRASYRVEWFNPGLDRVLRADFVSGGGVVTFTPPFQGQAVLYLERRSR